MAVRVSKSGGVYVEIAGDLTNLGNDLKKAAEMAKSEGGKISESLSSALTPRDISRSVNSITGYFTKMQQSAKALKADLTQYDPLFRKIGRQIGVAEKDLAKFSNTQQKALQSKLAREYERNVRGMNRALGDTAVEAEKAQSSIGGITRRVLSLAAAYVSARQAARFISSGIQENSTMQDAQTGIAAMLTYTQKLVDEQGKQLRGQEAYNAALQISEDIAKSIDAATVTASADYATLLKSFQTTLGPARQVGATWEENLHMLTLMSNAMEVLGVDMQRLDREMMSFTTGRDFSNSQVARSLGLSPETVKQWREGGQFVEQLTAALDEFRFAGERASNSYTAVSRDLRGTFESLAGEMTRGLFGNITQSMQELSRTFYTLEQDGGKSVYSLREEIAPLVQLGQDILTSIGEGAVSAVRSLGSALESASDFVKENRESFDSLGNVIKLVVDNSGSLIASYALYKTAAASVSTYNRSMEKGFLANVKAAGLLKTSMRALIPVLAPVAIFAGIQAIYSLVTAQEEGVDIAGKYSDAIAATSGSADEAATAIKRLADNIASMSREQLGASLKMTAEDLIVATRELDRFNKGITDYNKTMAMGWGLGSGTVGLDEVVTYPLQNAFDALKAGELELEKFIDLMNVAYTQGVISREELQKLEEAAKQYVAVNDNLQRLEGAFTTVNNSAAGAGASIAAMGNELVRLDTASVEKTIDDLRLKLGQLGRDAAGQASTTALVSIGIDFQDIGPDGELMAEAMSKYDTAAQKAAQSTAALSKELYESQEVMKQQQQDLQLQESFWKEFGAIQTRGYAKWHQSTQESLSKRVENFRKAGVDSVALAEWEAAQRLEIARTTEQEIAKITAQARLEGGEGSFADGFIVALGQITDGYKNAATELANVWGDFFSSFTQGFADSVGRAVVYGESLSESLGDVARQALSSLISGLVQMGTQWLINTVLVEAFTQKKIASDTAAAASGVAAVQIETTASTMAAAETAAAWAPAAATASIGSFGAAAAIAATAILGVFALTKGFQSGGYTGTGSPDQIAGVVHKGEYVIPAPVVSQIGVPAIESFTSGRSIDPGMFEQMPAAWADRPAQTQLNLSIENHGTSKDFEVQQLGPDEVRIIARDVMNREAPGLIASDLANPNSPESKALSQHTNAGRRR